MVIKSISDPSFCKYGKIVTGYDFSTLLYKLKTSAPKPNDGVVYVPSDPKLESDKVFTQLRDRHFGGMPIQIGYCCGTNTLLNCCEYHRDSEVNIYADDVILLVGMQQDICCFEYDTSKVAAFKVDAGMAIEFYATTLHYAPCNTEDGVSFQAACVLPKGTNTQKPDFEPMCEEDRIMTARNKWLIAHPDSDEAKLGAYAGLSGKNIDVADYF